MAIASPSILRLRVSEYVLRAANSCDSETWPTDTIVTYSATFSAIHVRPPPTLALFPCSTSDVLAQAHLASTRNGKSPDGTLDPAHLATLKPTH